MSIADDGYTDEVEVTGVVIRQWGRDMPGARCECSLAFMANHLTQLRAQKAALQVLSPASIHYRMGILLIESPRLGRPLSKGF